MMTIQATTIEQMMTMIVTTNPYNDYGDRLSSVNNAPWLSHSSRRFYLAKMRQLTVSITVSSSRMDKRCGQPQYQQLKEQMEKPNHPSS